MRAFIKMNRWLEFIEVHKMYGFLYDKKPGSKEGMYVRLEGDVGLPLGLFVTMDREVHLATPMGESPFMESQEEFFKDLIDDDFIEYVEGAFD